MPIFLQSLHGFDPLGSGYMVAGASSADRGGAGRRRTAEAMVGPHDGGGPLAMAVGLSGVALLMPVRPVTMPVLIV